MADPDSVGRWTFAYARDKALDWVFQKGIVVLAPYVAAVTTGVLAFLDGMPLSVLVVLVAIAFWAVTAGLNSFDLLLVRRTPRSKLVIGDAVGQMVVTPATKEPHGIQFGFVMQNDADFQIEYRVTDVQSMIGGRVNPTPKHHNMGAVLERRSGSIFWDADIPIDPSLLNKPLDGELKIAVRYGRKNRLSYHVEKRVRIEMFCELNGVGHFRYYSL